MLPSDFSVDGSGRVTLASPYINNIHSTLHNELYLVIPETLEFALPMRIAASNRYGGFGREKIVDCIRWYDGDLEAMNDQISLKGRTLQVIVRLANTVLTQEKPEYPGGRWHVEGCRSRVLYGRVRRRRTFKTARDAERDGRFQSHIHEFQGNCKHSSF